MDANSKYKVVVVDDSDFSRNLISSMLSESRFQVVGEAANANEAIRMLQENKVQIVILDVVMPEVSGIELAEKISKSFKDISIVMISSLAHETVVMDAINAGALDFLQKPFTKEALIDSLEKIAYNKERV